MQISLVADVGSLSFPEQKASVAMPLVADVGSLSFLERQASSANVTGCRCQFTYVS